MPEQDEQERPPILAIEDVRVSYGKKEVLHGISLEVPARGVVALLGHNGAGKSTTLRAAVGVVGCTAGRILFEGRDVTREPVSARLRLGIAYVEPRGILPGLTVQENLDIAVQVLSPKMRRATGAKQSEILDLFPVLRDRLRDHAGMLSGGQRQQLALSMALMVSPRVLMLDEPLLGLSPPLAEAVVRAIQMITRQSGTAALLVEQNVKSALEMSQSMYVLRAGEVTQKSASADILKRKDFWSII